MESVTAADGTLVVIVCRAKHLPNRRKLDKQSPYVTLRIGLQAAKTPAHFRAGQTPEWAFETRFELTRERPPVMKVDVLDETKGVPTPVGNTEIDCSRVFACPDLNSPSKYILDAWYDLHFQDMRAGMIYLEMTFYPHAPLVPPKVASRPAMVSHHSMTSLPSVMHPSPEIPIPLPPTTATSSKRASLSVDLIKSGRRRSAPATGPSDDQEEHELGTWSKRLAYFTSVPPTPRPRRHKQHENRNPSPEPGHRLYRGKLSKLKHLLSAKDPDAFHEFDPALHSVYIEDEESSLNFERSPSPHFKRSPSPNFKHSPSPHHRRSPSPHFKRSASPPPPPPPTHSVLSYKSHTPGNKTGPSTLETLDRLDRLALSSENIPFSADTIGLADDIVTTPAVSPLPPPQPANNDEIDPKYHAPTPGQFLLSQDRFRRGFGGLAPHEVAIDRNTSETGYLGNGRFSPSAFDRAILREPELSPKPRVPPKIPQGLTEMEYYLLEKDKYLRDLAGNRY